MKTSQSRRRLSRLTWHSFLSTIIPGLIYIVILPFHLPDMMNAVNEDLKNLHDVIGYLLFFIIAYIIGIINRVVCDYLWSGMNKDYAIIRYCKKKVYGENQEPYISLQPYTLAQICILLVVSWGISLIFRPSQIKNVLLCILVFGAVIILLIHFLNSYIKSTDRDIKDLYEKAHHQAICTTRTNDITVTEGAISFLQVIILPLMVISLYNPPAFTSCTTIISIIFILLLAIIALQFLCIKVYQNVWKEYKFYEEKLAENGTNK